MWWPFSRKGSSGFSSSSTSEEVTYGIDGTDLTVIVTGASSGIGAETTRVLAMCGVHVIMRVRNMKAGKDVKQAILEEIPTAKVDVMELDLSSMASIRKFASEFNASELPFNIFINGVVILSGLFVAILRNNAGIFGTPFALSEDNIELQFATNHSMKKTTLERKNQLERNMWPFSRKGTSGFSSSSTAEEVTYGIDAIGLTAIVTGASSGIGAETTRVLAMRGVHVIMGARNLIAAKDVKEAILEETPKAKVDVMELDLSSMASVRKFASEFNASNLPLNILINNAGIFATPFMLSKDNIELQFATNHIGHFLLTNLLLDTMKKTTHESKKQGRIVNVASSFHQVTYHDGIHFDKINDQSSYHNWLAYGQSKLANILHANELARRLKGLVPNFETALDHFDPYLDLFLVHLMSLDRKDGRSVKITKNWVELSSFKVLVCQEDGIDITANSLHPGAVLTNVFRHHIIMSGAINMLGRFVFKNVQQGAATTCYVALHPQVSGISGEFFADSNLTRANSQGRDIDLAKKLWDFSLDLTK
ncbi:hypothetical protein VNO77_33604 [Canavalia gladiata]|uniref:Uncharacterized protein n=1 Tax=Canavalia gladiata TaxID=3824 RepID=A0AAN9KCR8_CANGL